MEKWERNIVFRKNVNLDKIKKKYGYTGESYRELVSQILFDNNLKTTGRIMDITDSRWSKLREKIVEARTLKLPKKSDLINHDELSIKAAESGRLITETLRKRIADGIKTATAEFTGQIFDEKGKIKNKVIEKYEEKLKETFKNYTKRNKDIGMPNNIHTIAVTEFRGQINPVKQKYMEVMSYNNPDFIIKKKWRQNRSLSKEYRRGHKKVDGTSIGINDMFQVPVIIKSGGGYIQTGIVEMSHPHDRFAPADQTIGCNCDVEYTVRKRRTT